MATVLPFRALRPPPERALQVAAPPYDVVSTRRGARARRGQPRQLPARVAARDRPARRHRRARDAVYEQGQVNLAALVARGVLRQDAGAAPLRLRPADGRATGRRAWWRAPRWPSTYRGTSSRSTRRPGPTRRTTGPATSTRSRRTTSRCSSPTASRPELDALVEAVKSAAAPDLRAHHRRRRGAPALGGVARRRGRASRRSSARCRPSTWPTGTTARRRRRACTRCGAGRPGEHGAFLAVVFPHDQMQILAYNRLVRDRQGRSPEALLAALRERMDVAPADRPAPERPLTFGVLCGGRW